MAYDIAILGDQAVGRSLLDFNNKVVEGGEKLVQQVLILLFTDEAEPLSFGFGTQLPGLLAQTNTYDEDVINNEFNIAASKVADILRVSQPLDLPDNEKLSRIEVDVSRSETNPDQVEAVINVVSQDETATTVTLPIELTQVLGYGGNS